jgi:hypothetical protein
MSESSFEITQEDATQEDLAQEDQFSRGKEDALLGHSKQPPEDDPEQASQYDLGYSEGSIQRSLAETSSNSDES